jgi:hypothetical protein
MNKMMSTASGMCARIQIMNVFSFFLIKEREIAFVVPVIGSGVRAGVKPVRCWLF